MSKIVSITSGILTLIGVWYFPFVVSADVPANNEIEILISLCLVTLGMGLAYSFLYQKNYPVQVILVILVVEFILYQIFGQRTQQIAFVARIYLINLLLGTVLVIFGSIIGKAVTFILSPVQKIFQSIGLNFSIPVTAGILSFIISFVLLSFYY